MAWVLGVIKFIVAFVALASSVLFVLNIIANIVNPQIEVVDGRVIDKTINSRLVYGLILCVAWAILIAL